MTDTGQRVSNIGDISEVNYTLGAMSYGFPQLEIPKTWREWIVYLLIVAAALVSLYALIDWGLRDGEAKCQAQCIEKGHKGYSYEAPRRTTAEVCTCLNQ